MAKNKKTKKRIITIAAIILVIALIIIMSMPKPFNIQAADVTQGTIKTYVEERAKTSLPHVYRITMPFTGRVKPITLREGDAVKEGTIVALLDTDNLKTTLQLSNESLVAFEKSVEASQTQLMSSEAAKNYAEWYANAQKTLTPANLVSEITIKSAEKDQITAQALSQESQFAYQAMKILYTAMKLFPLYIERDLKRSILTSPVDGTVLKRYVSNERVLSAGESLVDIGDLSTLEITTDILSDDAALVKPGDTVDIYSGAIGDTPLKGTVVRVYPEGFTKLSSLGVEQQRVSVIVAIDPATFSAWKKQGRFLGVAYRVQVRIYTAQKNNALIVPRTALFKGDKGKWQVFAVCKNKAQQVEVTLGLMNDSQAEVLSGLKKGEQVIIAPATTLKDGVRVKRMTNE